MAVVNHNGSAGCRGYTLIDVQAGALGACLPFPAPGNMGGGCGWPADASEWTFDGRRLIYSYAMGAAGNGVRIVEIGSGETTLVPGYGTSSFSPAPDGVNVTFSAGGSIWVAGLDGSNLTLLAQGHSPAWQPSP